MWPVSIGTEEQGWVGGCGVTPARRVNPKTKPFEIPTLHHCQHCPLPAGAWHGPSTPPARPLPTPAVSSWGGQKGIVPKGTALFSVPAAPGWDGTDRQPHRGERREGTEGTGAHRAAQGRGDLLHRVPLCRCPSESWHWGGQRAAPCCPWSEASGCPCPSVGLLPQFPRAEGGVPVLSL